MPKPMITNPENAFRPKTKEVNLDYVQDPPPGSALVHHTIYDTVTVTWNRAGTTHHRRYHIEARKQEGEFYYFKNKHKRTGRFTLDSHDILHLVHPKNHVTLHLWHYANSVHLRHPANSARGKGHWTDSKVYIEWHVS